MGRGDEIDRRLPSAIRLAIVKTFSRRGGARVSSRFGGAITMFLQNRRTDWVHVRARGQFPQLRLNSIGTPDPLIWNYAATPNTNICCQGNFVTHVSPHRKKPSSGSLDPVVGSQNRTATTHTSDRARVLRIFTSAKPSTGPKFGSLRNYDCAYWQSPVESHDHRRIARGGGDPPASRRG